MARPKLPDHLRKVCTTVYLAPATLARLKREARKRGTHPGAYASALLDAAAADADKASREGGG